MRSVIYLVKNNIKHKTGAFKGIIALMAIIVFSFSGSVSNSKNLHEALSNSFDNYRVGDIIMSYSEGKLDDTVKNGLDANSHVKSWRADPMLFVKNEYYLNGKVQDKETRLVKEKDEIKLFNEEETGFVENTPKLGKGEIYVSFSLSKVESLKIGDELEIQTAPGKREKFKIKGFIEEPIYGSSVVAYEMFYISAEDYDRIDNGITDGTVNRNFIFRMDMLHIFSDGELSEFKLVKQLNDECGLVDSSMLYVTKPELFSYTEIYADTGTSLLYIFVGLLTVVVILMMLNSINSTIEMQYVDLGILKSQGFTVWQIRFAYMIQYILALLIGTVIGLIVSVPLLAVLGKLFRTVTGIHTDCSIDFVSCGFISLGIIAAFTLFLLVTTRKLGKLSPVNALNNAHKDVHFTGRLNVPMKQNALSVTMSLRQLTSGFRHYVFILLITVILMFFMTTVFNLCRGLNFEEIFGMDNRAIGTKLFNECTDDDRERIRSRLSEIDSGAEIVYNSYVDNILADDVLFGAYANDDLERYFKPIYGKVVEYDNEVMITTIVAEELDKGIGDTMTISNGGVKADYMIVGIYQTAAQTGRIFGLTLEGGAKINIKPDTALIYLSDSSKASEIANTLNSEFGEISLSMAEEEKATNTNLISLVDTFLVIIILVVIGVTSIFLLVAVSMICKITFLRERTDLGIFKATGFTTGNLRGMFSVRFILLSIMGCIIGLILAMFFAKPLLSELIRFTGLTDFTAPLSAFDIILPAGIICDCFALFSYIASARIKSVQTTELICE